MPPQIISHYNILGEIGRGGMGVVYKAADTKLNRTVALKVLPPHALTTEDDRARFYREARSAAALHHPHIATVFEIDEDDGRPFIAMEFVNGKSLADRIGEGPLPLRDAVSIASQMAEGLKAAHAADIVHRDIKSANIMLTPDSRAKILDFGLAKTAASTKLTQMGSTLGTVAYMSPQQARGEDVDHRTDLWSLGAVLYEMISGKLPFPGDFEQAVVYSILNEEPKPLTSIRTGVPMGLEWIVSKLLAKDPEDRYQNAADLLVDLRTVDLSSAALSRVRNADPSTLRSSTPPASRWWPPSYLPAGMAIGLVAGILLMGLAWMLWPGDGPYVETSVKRFQVSLPTAGSLAGVDITPDGSEIVYADANNTVDNVRVLNLATGRTRLIEGSAGTFIVSVSPDGLWLLLTKDVTVERVALSGGTPLLVARAQEGTPRADWGPGDWIVFENQQAIWRASTATNEIAPFTIRDSTAGEVDHDWPRMLPDGQTIAATIEYQDKPSAIGLWDFATGEKKGQINLPGYRTRFAASGHLLFVLGPTSGNLIALPFDLSALTATAPPIPVLSNVSTLVASISDGGTLVTAGAQGTERSALYRSQLADVTFPSIVRPLDFEPVQYRRFELSPDGNRIVAEIRELNAGSLEGSIVGSGEHVWVLDLNRGTKLQLTSGTVGRAPTWASGGDSVAYVVETLSTSAGGGVWIRAADGSGNARPLFDPGARVLDVDMGPDDSLAAYVVGETEIGVTRLLVRNLRTGETVDLTGREDINVRYPRISPDGRYVAYERDRQVVVQAVDGKSVPVRIGQAGSPTWAHDGSALYSAADGVMFRRDISLSPSFSHTPPSTPVIYGIGAFDHFGVYSDARTGIVNLPVVNGAGSVASQPSDSAATITVTVNWFEVLK